jgi:hypothetical protein
MDSVKMEPKRERLCTVALLTWSKREMVALSQTADGRDGQHIKLSFGILRQERCGACSAK